MTSPASDRLSNMKAKATILDINIILSVSQTQKLRDVTRTLDTLLARKNEFMNISRNGLKT